LEARHGVRLANGAEEDGLELVHARVGEEERGVIVGDDGARGHCREGSACAAENANGCPAASGTEAERDRARCVWPGVEFGGARPLKRGWRGVQKPKELTDSVTPLLKVVEEGLAHLLRGPLDLAHFCCSR